MSSIKEKWTSLQSEFHQNKTLLDVDIRQKISSLLRHKDLEYVRDGMSLLLSFGTEQICRYFQLQEDYIVLQKRMKDYPNIGIALVESIPEDEVLEELSQTGAFWSLFGEFVFQDLPKNLQEQVVAKSKEMRRIPAGAFMMGCHEPDFDWINDEPKEDEFPQHPVTLPNDFWVGKYLVTQALWESVMVKNESKFKGSTRPIERVDLYDAIEFCNRLSVLEGFEPYYTIRIRGILGSFSSNPYANGYRLLTEAEWEYAARGGEYHTYAGGNWIDEVGWTSENSDGQSHPVGLKRANGFGLYDMSGNVQEWCSDVKKAYVSGKELGNHVVRGGGWYYTNAFARTSFRYSSRGFENNFCLGFRLARSIL